MPIPKLEIVDFLKYCNGLGIDVIPLQQSFGHVEYILRNEKYKELREDQKDYSQVCPLQTKRDSALFSDLYTELASTHASKNTFIFVGMKPICLVTTNDAKQKLRKKENRNYILIISGCSAT